MKLSQLVNIMLLVLFFGCSSTEKTTSTTKTDSPSSGSKETINWSGTRTPIAYDSPIKIHGLEDSPNLLIAVKDTTQKEDLSLTPERRGFRIQVYSNRDRKIAEDIAIEARTMFNLKAYVIFAAPNYTVRVGNYGDRNAALIALSQLSEFFPNSNVVPDIIE